MAITLAKVLKAARKRHGHTVAAAARECRASHNAYKDWERGAQPLRLFREHIAAYCELPLDTVERLSRAIRKPPSSLL